MRAGEKKRMYASRVLEVEQGSFTPLVFNYPEEWQMNARGIKVDWLNFYQPRGERITALQCHGVAPVSFALLRSPLLCLRGPRSTLRAPLNTTDIDFEF